MNNETTTQATETSNTSKGGVENTYPFRSKASIKALLGTDDGFVREALVILGTRTAARTADDKAMGFMSSHLKAGTALATKIAGGEELSEEEAGKAREIALSYTKQLAAHFRAEQIAANPELEEVARKFSAAPKAKTEGASEPAADAPASEPETPAEGEATSEAA